ncbi:GNAT family [Colletotrichum truncatum]|uniref:GNAT family n=1 Tax=Colletotrichum truncatum TaxID=5467 RepID=A0ACC3YIR8_COLTU|nr:GNAT family [Colletotrichum truncatum]KAF6794356.1 GNAT family [Colletotrichum truncatum]
MGLTLHEVRDDEEFVPLLVAFREGFATPDCALWRLFMGDWKPHDPAAREAALQEATERLRSWHRADPTSTWLKVVDDETGELVAGGRWSLYKKEKPNPYTGQQRVEALWFPDGEPRRIASGLMNDFLGTAVRNANRPHAYLNFLFTVPEHRRRGAASLIMDWGVERAGQQGLDVYIEATENGKPLYEKYGLEALEQSSLEVNEAELPPTSDPLLRDEVIRQLTPFTWWSMVKRAEV